MRECKMPRHKPIDVQTSDAGPGVGTNEKLVRIRNAEYFLINDLDLQCRMHYAPRDSKMHSVEKVMSSLNEAAGDGTTIEVKRPTLYQEIGEQQLLQMSVRDFKEFEEKRNVEIAKDCARQVAMRYDGVKCRGTLLHAYTPNYDEHSQLFFDKKYMKKCTRTTSASIGTLPGYHYFNKVSEFFQQHYILFYNGMEGIRNACSPDPCEYHQDRGLQFCTGSVDSMSSS